MSAPSSLSPPAVLLEAAQFVLETMFFAESEPVAPPQPPPHPPILAAISFEGDRRGRLAIGLPESCARLMAASFEGIPDVAEVAGTNVDCVVLELANMICGATLTRLHGDGLFRLGSPELDLQRGHGPLSAPCQCWLRIPLMNDALLHLALELEDQP
jgi:CheY-specific phosphatase CheX